MKDQIKELMHIALFSGDYHKGNKEVKLNIVEDLSECIDAMVKERIKYMASPDAVKNIVSLAVRDTTASIQKVYLASFIECKMGKGMLSKIRESTLRLIGQYKFPTYSIENSSIINLDETMTPEEARHDEKCRRD